MRNIMRERERERGRRKRQWEKDGKRAREGGRKIDMRHVHGASYSEAKEQPRQRFNFLP